MYEQFLISLKHNAYKSSIISHDNLLIAMYHANTLEHNKTKVMDSLTKSTGNIRVVIATSALGCGVNCKELSYVCHFGPSHGLVEYCQQIGRAGRSGEILCHAVLYSYPQKSALCSKEMRDYVSKSNESCLRTQLFSPFNENEAIVPSLKPSHICCSFCSVTCECGSDACVKLYEFEKEGSNMEDTNKIPVREVTPNDKSKILELLQDFHKSFNPLLSVPSAFSSGLTLPIVNSIAEDLEFIDSPDYLLNHFVSDESIAKELYTIILVYFLEGSCSPIAKRSKDTINENTEQRYEFSDFSFGDDSDFDDEAL